MEEHKPYLVPSSIPEAKGKRVAYKRQYKIASKGEINFKTADGAIIYWEEK